MAARSGVDEQAHLFGPVIGRWHRGEAAGLAQGLAITPDQGEAVLGAGLQIPGLELPEATAGVGPLTGKRC